MSGLLERVVGDWLIEADERSVQSAFAAALARTGGSIRYYSSHSTLELGRDLVSQDHRGHLTAYQLKAGAVDLSVWRNELAGELADACEGAIQLPGHRPKRPTRVVAVVSGRCSDPVLRAISERNDTNLSRGVPVIELIQVDELREMITRSLDEFVPGTIPSLHRLLRAYLANPRGPAQCGELESLFTSCLERAATGGGARTRRAVLDVAVAAAFAASPFIRNVNWIAVLQTWTLAATSIMRAAIMNEWGSISYRTGMGICQDAIADASEQLMSELRGRDSLLEARTPDEFYMYRVRSLVILGFAAAVVNAQCIRGGDVREDSRMLGKLAASALRFSPWGEGAWNYSNNLAVAIRHTAEGTSLGAGLVANWLSFICAHDLSLPLHPYVGADEWLADLATGAPSPPKRRETPGAYSLRAAVNFLVRRLWRQAIGRQWQTVSKYAVLQLEPDNPTDILCWHVHDAAVSQTSYPIEGSWRALKDQAQQAPETIFEALEFRWLLPYFMVTYPHRVVSALSDALDFYTTPAARVGTGR